MVCQLKELARLLSNFGYNHVHWSKNITVVYTHLPRDPNIQGFQNHAWIFWRTPALYAHRLTLGNIQEIGLLEYLALPLCNYKLHFIS